MIESSVCAVPGLKADSITPLESSCVMNSRKKRILTLPSRIKRRPIPLNSSWMLPFEARSLDIDWITSWMHVSTESLLNGVSFERTVKLRGTVGICPVGGSWQKLITLSRVFFSDTALLKVCLLQLLLAQASMWLITTVQCTEKLSGFSPFTIINS